MDLSVLSSNFFKNPLWISLQLKIITVYIKNLIYFCKVQINKKIINQCISVLMLVIYLFGSSSALSSHNHDDDNHHHHNHNHQDLPICENLDVNSFNTSECSHDSHIISSEESCPLCDHFSNCKPAILDNMINTVSESFTVKEVQLFTSLYIIDANNTRNKSPPFII